MAYPLTNDEARDLVELIDDRSEVLSNLLFEGLDIKQAHNIRMKLKRLEYLRERLSQC